MRVITGSARGRRLQTLEGNDVRLGSFEEYYDAVMFNKDEAFGRALRAFEGSF